MADTTAFAGRLTVSPKLSMADRRRPAPAPLRTRSECEPIGGVFGMVHNGGHARNKSTSLAAGGMAQPAGSSFTRTGVLPPEQELDEESSDQDQAESPDMDHLAFSTAPGVLTPPPTPVKGHARIDSTGPDDAPETLPYDFAKIDYELERAKVLGTGLWSTVFLADAVFRPADQTGGPGLPSPPSTPQKKYQTLTCSLFAVKKPARRDAIPVFRQEAKVLTHLMRQRGANQFIIPFYGLDQRNNALVFEAVIGGSFENLNNRLKQMTEVSRHLELISIFPGLANDLVSGLEFIHAAGVVHADLKPANILLDISEHYSLPRPVIRARYIDFSAAFRPWEGDSTKYAGGSWDYMAPEQMRIQKDLNTPTPASDIWSLGITLLTLLVGGSPYTAACGDNMFMLREAIKGGDPLSYARMDPVPRKRMAACQDFVDCCKLALQKDRDRRTTATKWKAWLANQHIDAHPMM